MHVGISACLLGDAVRYDGGHKRDAWLVEELGRHVEWVKICPEVECGMGTPREPIRLVDRDGRLRLMTVATGADFTDRMTAFTRVRLDELAALDLCGYVLKADSPSCGPDTVAVHGDHQISRTGTGVFAAALLMRFPGMPIEDERRLADPAVRAHFVARLAAYRDARESGRQSG
jgi:uncharacterized protein YbbK (DUF523 family)